jgi:Transposase
LPICPHRIDLFPNNWTFQKWRIGPIFITFKRSIGHEKNPVHRATNLPAGRQVAFALKQAETGVRVKEVCRKIGISEATFYNWKKKPACRQAGSEAWVYQSFGGCVNWKRKTIG